MVIGYKHDRSDLKGCFNWLRDFITNPCGRYAPSLDELSKDKVYKQFYQSIYGSKNVYNHEMATFYNQFDISHLGMSSFNNVLALLLVNKHGIARCIWQQDDEEVKEAFSKIEEINSVIKKAIRYFEEELTKNKKH